MKHIKLFLAMALTACLWTSCSEEELDSKSIFETSDQEHPEFDNWLLNNFTKPYNIEFKYRYEDNESDPKYNVVPATYEKSIALAKLMKYLWVDAYEELSGPDFIRKYCPKMMFLVGSPEYEKSGGSMVLGTAEGGMKITLFNVNGLDLENPDIDELNYWYFKTMHHEFAHILHQTKNYPTDFNLISAGKYQGAGWVNVKTDKEAFEAGFVSRYAMSETQEDFVEVIAIYVTYTDKAWQNILTQAGASGKSIILQKWEMAKDWLMEAYGIDMVKLHEIVQERELNIGSLDLGTI